MNKFDCELRKKFKESFKSIELTESRKIELEKEICKEEKYLRTTYGKFKLFLDREIEIDIKAAIACAIILIAIPTVFSIKGIEEVSKEVRVIENSIK